jgi:hypothetical protein
MHQGCVRSRQRRQGGKRRGGGRHRQTVGGAGGVLHPRAGHRPRTVPVRPRRVPGPLVRRRRQLPRAAGRSIAGGVPGHVRGPPPRHRRTPRPPSGPQCGPRLYVVLRPTKSVSVLYGLGDTATGRAVLSAHHAGVAEATAYLDDHLGTRRGHGGQQHWTARGCWRSGSTTAPAAKATRCCTPISWSPTVSRGRTAAGRPWTAGTCTGIGWPPTPSTGRPTSANFAGHLGWSGRRPTATATGNSRACLRT